MENETKPKKDYLLPASIVFSALIVAGAWVYTKGLTAQNPEIESISACATDAGIARKTAEQTDKFVLPAVWGDLGKQMIETGVIDKEKFETLYARRGGLSEEERNLLYAENNAPLTINEQNSAYLLNLLWAFGLGNKNPILEEGPMTDVRYGGAGNFASTAGWTLAKDGPMEHYSKHTFVALTAEQQNLVEKVSKNIYRPCCGNSTYFPDCNHGMAMLGLLELMASQGATEKEMYEAALQVNAYWFPDTYLNITKYLEQKGINSAKADPKEILGTNFSSGSGYQRILSEIEPVQSQGGSGCGV